MPRYEVSAGNRAQPLGVAYAGMPWTMKKEVQRYTQRRKQNFDRYPSYFPTVKDPRGPITKKPTHTYLDIDDMPHIVSPRAHEVNKLLEEDFTGLRAYGAPQLVCPLKFEVMRSAIELKMNEINSCLDLIEKTSKNDYRTSSIGWNPRKKKAEMMDKNMIYLLIRQGDVGGPTEPDTQSQSEESEADVELQALPQPDTLEQLIQGYASDSDAEGSVESEQTIRPNTPPNDSVPVPDPAPFGPQPMKDLEWPNPADTGRILGFVSFMFTYDDPPHDDREVVYIYEIHLHEELRGRGLGSNLIKFVEHAAGHCGIPKVMLTVFIANVGAKALYEKLGYTRDECSPRDRVMRTKIIETDYLIMSKEIPHIVS
ncbi:Nn.00g097120.m01.CDS01 [Neocucurbitaria sp. VM-36]